MAIPIIFVAIGALMAYSAIKGVSIADAFKGATGQTIDPSGPHLDLEVLSDTPPTGDLPVDPKGNAASAALAKVTPHQRNLINSIKGPNAAILKDLAVTAVTQFHLSLNNVCRSALVNRAVGGSSTSFHLQCRAFDATGTVANRVAYARYAAGKLSGISGAEVFCDQAGMVAPGFDHSDHVHTGA